MKRCQPLPCRPPLYASCVSLCEFPPLQHLRLSEQTLYSSPLANDTHPADGEDHTRLARADAHEAVAELPVEEMLTDEGDETEGHGCSQHVEDTCHVIYIQLAAHNLVLLIVTNASEPQCFQLLHLT